MSELTNRAIAKLLDYLDTQAGGYATRITRHGEIVPDYLGDMDEALTLPLGSARRYFALRGQGGWTAEIWDGGWCESTGKADTPAEAICKAWWAWKDAQEAR